MASPHASVEWLKPNALVLAKMDPYPYWPAQICHEFNEELGRRWRMVDDEGRTLYWCVFFNDYTGQWMELETLKPYTRQDSEDCQRNDFRGTMSAEEEKALDGAFEEGIDRYEESFILPIEREEIREGDVVIAFHAAYPPWPSVVELAENSGADIERNAWRNDLEYHCKFLGNTVSYDWIPHKHVIKYTKNRMECYKVRKSNKLFEQYEVAKNMAKDLYDNGQDDAGSGVDESQSISANGGNGTQKDVAQSARFHPLSLACYARARGRGRNEADA